MDKDQGDGIILEGAFYDLTLGDSAAIYSFLKEVGGLNNLVLAVQINNLEYFLLEVPHGMVEVIKNLLRGFINGTINDSLFEKLPGYCLHQPDTEGIVRTNTIYLLQFFGGSL